MESRGPTVCVKTESIVKTIKILNEMKIPTKVNKNIRARTIFVVPGIHKIATIGFVVLNVRTNIGGVEYPAEFALYFNAKDHRIRIKEGRIVCNLETLSKLAKYLEL